MAKTAKLKRLRVYPVKGMDGMDVTTWELDPYGLRLDRRWMVVDPSGRCITRREQPLLARVRAEIEEDRLVLSTPHQPSITLPLEPEPGPTEPATIAGEAIVVRVVSDDANRWISQELRTACRIVFLPPGGSRTVEPGLGSRKASLALQDELPLHLITSASLEDLSRRVKDGVSVETLSPNLVVDAGEAYDEDTWRRIRVGDVELEVLRPWAHRVDSGAAAPPDPDWVLTLDGYRTLGGRPRFGQLALHATTTGVLRVGALVEVLERGEAPGFGADEPEAPAAPAEAPAAKKAAPARKADKKNVRVIRIPGRRTGTPAPEDEPDFDILPDEEEGEKPARSGKAAPPVEAGELEAGPVEEAAPAQPIPPAPEPVTPAAEPEPEPEPAGEPEPASPPADVPVALELSAERVPDLAVTVRLLVAASLAEDPADARPLAEACIGAALLITAWDGDTLVGLLRGWTDAFRDGFIADVAVHPDHLAGGTAADLVRRAVALHPDVRWVLRASPGSAYLGSALGWKHAGSGWYLSPR